MLPNHEHQYIFAAAILQSPIMDSLHDKAHRSISTLAVDFQDLIYYVVGVTKPVRDTCVTTAFVQKINQNMT